MNIIINAANITASGPISVLTNLLPELVNVIPDYNFIELLPKIKTFNNLPKNPRENRIFLNINKGILNDLFRLKFIHYDIYKYIRKYKPIVCFTFGDVGPIKLRCNHIIFLQQSLLLEDNINNNKNYGWNIIKRMYLKFHFRLSAKHSKLIVVQTPVMKKKLMNQYNISDEKIIIISQPVPKSILMERKIETHNSIKECKKPIKLLFLAAYYKHKNHDILPEVVRVLRKRGINNKVQIFVTLDKSISKTKNILRLLDDYKNEITNLGNIPYYEVSSYLKEASALFLPSYAESYGLVYLESFACGVPVITSNLDFAKWICGDLALYFDPKSAESIVNAIEIFKNGYFSNKSYFYNTQEHLKKFPKNWSEVAHNFKKVLTLKKE